MTSGQTSSIFCAHCGTGNKHDAFMCDRCGERVYRLLMATTLPETFVVRTPRESDWRLQGNESARP